MLVASDDMRMAVIWIASEILWFTSFVEGSLQKNLGKFVPYLAIVDSILTAWIPGFLMLAGKW